MRMGGGGVVGLAGGAVVVARWGGVRSGGVVGVHLIAN